MPKYTIARPTAVIDTECFRAYWSLAVKDTASGRRKLFEMYEGQPLDVDGIKKIMRNWRVVTFNGNHYDMPMIALALSGADCEMLKEASDRIIQQNLRSWQFLQFYDLQIPDHVDHIDLIEMAPSAARRFSLKMYAGVMHSRKMQDLPFEHNADIGPAEREVLRGYVWNDCEVTEDLFHEMKPQLDLRAAMSDEYDVDMRSKSDAQMGEAIIKTLVERQTGRRLFKPDIVPGSFHYQAPAYIRFQTPELQELLSLVLRTKFEVWADGYVKAPDLEKKTVRVGSNEYTFGIGGLHSKESGVSHFADDEYLLEDNDVASYYPNMMIVSGREPANMRGMFQPIFQRQVRERIEAKRAGNEAVAESRKIVCNGLFGKTGSPFSIVYSPQMMIQTTITGQLSILMLIEQCELNGHQVISGNTDGFVTKVRRDAYPNFRCIIFDWEEDSRLETEKTPYRSLHSRSVNDYVGITTKGKLKLKGGFAPSGRGIPKAFGLKKNPDVEICFDAVAKHLLDGTPLEDTIYKCQDIRKFVTVRVVKGGALKNGEYIGKTIRYYYSDDSPEPIVYRENGNKVPSSEGGYPCLELPDELPANIDFNWYIREANAIMFDVGMRGVDPALEGRSGFMLARRPSQKTVHTVALPSGVALCGAKRDSIREIWTEYPTMPDGMRHCSKCKKEEL